jgi:hypothetical protein
MAFDFDVFFVDDVGEAQGEIVPLGLDVPSEGSATPSVIPSASPTSNELAWENDGGTITATGRFLGSSWQVEQLDYRDGLRSDIAGDVRSFDQPAIGEPIVLSFPGSRYQALLLVLTDLKVDEVEVTSEGSWTGRWMPSTTDDAREARLWIVELPGAGIGTLSFDGTKAGKVSWP